MMVVLLSGCGLDAAHTETQTESDLQAPSSEMQEAHASSILLHEDEQISLWLVQAIDSVDMIPKLFIKLQNRASETCYGSMDSIIMNDRYALSDAINFSAESGQSCYRALGLLDESRYVLQGEALTKLSFSLATFWSYGSDLPKVELHDQMVDMAAYSEAAILWEPYLCGKADRQMIFEDETIQIELLNLGRSISADYSCDNLKGMVRFVNKSSHKLPIGIGAVRINGAYFENVGNMMYLDGNRSVCLDFSVEKREIEDEGITGVSDLSLLILKDKEELTGTVNLDGGSWYEIELSEKSEQGTVRPEGTLIFSEHDIEIYDLGPSQWQSSYGDSDTGYYYWNIYIVNNSDQNMDFMSLEETYIDPVTGEHCVDKDKLYVPSVEIGSQSGRRIEASYHYEGDEARPIISFVPEFRTLGGGSILYKTTQPLIFEYEP